VRDVHVLERLRLPVDALDRLGADMRLEIVDADDLRRFDHVPSLPGDRMPIVARAGSGDPALAGKEILWRLLNTFLPELPYFFLQVHFSDGWLHPTHTPFLIAMPQVLHGSHPQVWHMETSFLVVLT
jgi:hypothetical protein